jgi:hypothetical protein
MLISMPQGTSTILGAFQAMIGSPLFADWDVLALRLNYCELESSPVKSSNNACCGAKNDQGHHFSKPAMSMAHSAAKPV